MKSNSSNTRGVIFFILWNIVDNITLKKEEDKLHPGYLSSQKKPRIPIYIDINSLGFNSHKSLLHFGLSGNGFPVYAI